MQKFTCIMFPRPSYQYRLLAVCTFVGLIWLGITYQDYRFNNMHHLSANERYVNDFRKSTSELFNASLNETSYNETMPSQPIVNTHNFSYELDSKQLCSNKEVKFFIYVHSAPSHHKKRHTIRQTWGSKMILEMYKIRMVFVMGTVNDTETMDQVMLEYICYGDIMVEDFIDTYRNLTYKAIVALKWVTHFCNNVTFVIKSDDDILIDMHALMNIMNSTEVVTNGTSNVILCNQWLQMQVINRVSGIFPKKNFQTNFSHRIVLVLYL